MDFTKIQDWLRFSTKYILAIVIASGLLLFLHSFVLPRIGLASFLDKYLSWILLAFWGFGTLLIINIVVGFYIWVGKQYEGYLISIERKNHLSDPSQQEKEILFGYIVNDAKTQYLDISNSAVINLTIDNIIKSTNIWSGEKCGFEIQPWAWKYLQDHADRIFTREDMDNFPRN